MGARDDNGPEPVARAYDPDLEVELELVTDDLADWVELGDSQPARVTSHTEVFEIDPVHPLRRLGSWVNDLAEFAPLRA
jgi:hypothetical protein